MIFRFRNIGQQITQLNLAFQNKKGPGNSQKHNPFLNLDNKYIDSFNSLVDR